jgi:hypothetical protein
MKVFRTQIDGAEASVHVHNVYDAAGQRVKKLVRKTRRSKPTTWGDLVRDAVSSWRDQWPR